MRNGYALCTEEGLATIARQLDALDVRGVDKLRDPIRIGIHSGVQVTDVEDEHLVSQAFCSALPVSYSSIPSERWKSFAPSGARRCLRSHAVGCRRQCPQSGSNVLFLTRLGGGAFGNEPAWIHDAMRRALTKVAGISLDVRVVSYRQAGCRARAPRCGVRLNGWTWCKVQGRLADTARASSRRPKPIGRSGHPRMTRREANIQRMT